MSGLGPAACWLAHKRLESWSRMAKERVGAVRKAAAEKKSEDKSSTAPLRTQSSLSPSTSEGGNHNDVGSHDVANGSQLLLKELKVPCEPDPIQQGASTAAHTINPELLRGPIEITSNPLHTLLQHQSKSFPPRLVRTPSVSSQSSAESGPTKQSISSAHRGSSPQIRTFGPDGKTSVTFDRGNKQVSKATRSPSPKRAVSLDARCSSPSTTDFNEMRTTSPSHCNHISLSGGSANSLSLSSPRLGRCLSPLMIPSRATATVDPGCGPASPLGTIQPDLYNRHEGPIYMNAPESNSALGRLRLRIKYDYHVFDLTIHLIEAQNLCAIEDGGFRDPYVRLMLLPDVDQRKRQTTVHRGETSPYFDQHFKFPVSRDQLQGKELVLQVLDYDRYSHNDIIGEVKIMIDELDISKSVEIWADIVRSRKSPENRPELLLSLNYLPQAERLTVVIMKAKNLDTVQEPYVKLYLIHNGKRMKKKKTGGGKSHDPSNPIWNEAFTFNLPSTHMALAALEIYVVSTGGESNAAGSCGIGPQESGPGRQHWQDMIHNARKPTAMWHFLR